MSGDKRSVTTDALATLGTIIDETQKRDAIHLAVEPVIAGERLVPGEHISVTNGIAYGVDKGEGLGIVDPFLLEWIEKGDRFWFIMYPRQVQSLRHVWTHPAFPDEAGTPAPSAVSEQWSTHRSRKETGTPAPSASNKEASEAWLRNFIASADCPGYEDVIAAAVGKNIYAGKDEEGYYRISNDGEYLYFGGRDAHGDIPPEFWDHIEIVTGQMIPKQLRASYFTCSC